jgi:FkbM family methyltransferase
MPAGEETPPLDTIYGRFGAASRPRLDLTYDYEHGTVVAFRRMVERMGATRLLDVGANIGVYAVHLSRLPALARIHCFEPSPPTFEELERNLALQQDPSRFETHRLALSDRTGRAAFAVYGAMAGHNAIAETRVIRQTPRGTTEVDCAPLDGLLDARGETFAAKIDVEGHELAVLAGARGYLAGNRGLVQVESFEARAPELRAAMADLGYAPLGRMKDDHFFANLEDAALLESLRDIIWEATAAELEALRVLRQMRREATRRARATFDTVRYRRDPVTR